MICFSTTRMKVLHTRSSVKVAPGVNQTNRDQRYLSRNGRSKEDERQEGRRREREEERDGRGEEQEKYSS